MKYLIAVLLLPAALNLFAARLFTREITIGGEGKEERSAALTFFVPDRVAGYRLVDHGGSVRPMTVIGREGGKIDAFFNARPGEKLILEYHDSPVQSPAAEQKSGLLHLYKEFKGEAVHSLQQFQRLWRNSLRMRAGWEKRLYLGGNKLGNARHSLNLYRGIIRISRPGRYTFHTASTDASFLLIDGKEIARYPGNHWIGPAQTGRFKGDVELSAGLHRIEYFHANNQWSYFVIAACSRPGDRKMTILPEKMFLPLLPVTQDRLKNEDGSDAADLSWKRTGTIDLDGRQMQELTFSNGEILYRFSPGPFHKNGYTIYLGYHFAAPFVSEQEGRRMLLGAMKQDEVQPLDATGYRFLADAIPQFKMKELSSRFYDRILYFGARMPKDAVFKFYRTMMMDDDLAAERYEKIEKDLNRMLNQSSDHARLELSRLLFYCMDRRKEAEVEFRKIQPEKLTADFQRNYRILEADMALFFKGYDAALELYRKMESVSRKMSEREKLEADGNLVSLRNALVTRRYRDATDYLARVENARPEIRLNPEIMWLKSQFLAKQGRVRLAAYWAEAVRKLQPSSGTDAAAALFLARDLLRRGKTDRAHPLLKEIAARYPKSMEAIAAEKLLSGRTVTPGRKERN